MHMDPVQLRLIQRRVQTARQELTERKLDARAAEWGFYLWILSRCCQYDWAYWAPSIPHVGPTFRIKRRESSCTQ